MRGELAEHVNADAIRDAELTATCAAVSEIELPTLEPTNSPTAVARSRFSGAARFANCVCRWSTNAAVANVPIAPDGSPRSKRQSVSRLTNKRDAMSEVEILRLRRAIARSRPSFRRA